MKLTEKTTTTETQTTELVCELTEEEFEQLSAETAAHLVVDMMEDETNYAAGLAMTALLAKYSAKLAVQMFHKTDKSNETENKEEK